MKYLAVLVLLWLSVGMGLANPPNLIQDYMSQHAQVWNNGGVCRHAAAELAVRAAYDGLEYRVPQFSTDKEHLYHVTFSVKYRDKWYHIDSILGRHGIYYPNVKETTLYSPQHQVYLFRQLSSRPLVAYIEDIEERYLRCWYERCENTTIGRIDSKLDQLDQLSRFLSKWEEIFRNYKVGDTSWLGR